MANRLLGPWFSHVLTQNYRLFLNEKVLPSLPGKAAVVLCRGVKMKKADAIWVSFSPCLSTLILLTPPSASAGHTELALLTPSLLWKTEKTHGHSLLSPACASKGLDNTLLLRAPWQGMAVFHHFWRRAFTQQLCLFTGLEMSTRLVGLIQQFFYFGIPPLDYTIYWSM